MSTLGILDTNELFDLVKNKKDFKEQQTFKSEVSAPKEEKPSTGGILDTNELFDLAKNQKKEEEKQPSTAFAPVVGTKPAAPSPVPPPAYSKEEYTIEDLSTNQDIFNDISSYMKSRFNEQKKEKESNAEFVERFLGKMRFNDFNTYGGVNELNWIRNANKQDAIVASKAHDIYDKTASFYEKGGGSTAGALGDVAKAMFLDPLSYLGFGVGAVAKTAAARSGLKAGINSILGAKIVGGAAAVEGTVGAAQALIPERIGQETDIAMGREVREISPLALGLGASLGAFGGAIGAASVVRGGVTKTTAEELKEVIASKSVVPSSPTAPLTGIETRVADALTNNMDELVSQYMKMEGADILERIDPATALTDSKVRKDMSESAIRVAAKIITDDPSFQFKEGQKISDVIVNVLKNVDQIDDVVLERAVNAVGLTPDEFAKTLSATMSEAGRQLQQLSAVSKMFNRMKQIDPAFEKRASELFGKDDELTSSMGYVGQAGNRLERESKAWVVSGLGTTARNIIGTTAGLTFRGASSLLEGLLFTVGRNLKAAATGQTTNVMSDLGKIGKDAWESLARLGNAGITAELTDELLKHNPSLRNHLLHALQETGTQDISAPARFFNKLNVAQDAFFRRAIFSGAVEKKLNQMGVNMYQLLSENKMIPADVLSSSIDEALKATFSYMPKPSRKGVKTLEAGAETMAHHFVKVFENIPGGSLLVTFPRFMSNAMAFQYRYSAFGGASGASDIFNGLIKNSKVAGSGDKELYRGVQNFSRGVVGTAAIYGAYKYRQENASTNWYEVTSDSGMRVDMRPVFPIGPYLAVGEFLAKYNSGDPIKAGEMLQTIAGMKLPAGAQNTIIDQMVSAASSERDADKFNISAGKIVGDFISRFTAPYPIRTMSDLYGLIDREEALARDPNVIASDDKIMESAANRVMKTTAGFKQMLPEAVTRLRPETQVQEGEFFRDLLGVTAKAPINFAEREVARLNIDPYRLFGGSSGDREYDRIFIKLANPIVLKTMDQVIKDKRYQNLTPSQQRIFMFSRVQAALEIPRAKVESIYSKDINQLFRLNFNKMSADERRAINEAYAKDHQGRTLEEDNAYKQVPKYEAKAVLPYSFAAGGVVKGITKAAKKFFDTDKIVNKKAKDALPLAPDVEKAIDDKLVIKLTPDQEDFLTKEKRVMQDMQQTAQKTAIPPDDQSMEELVTAAEKSFIKEPTPPAKTWETVEGGGESQMSPDQYWDSGTSMTTDHYKFTTDFFKGFPEEEIIKVEKELADKYGDVGYIMQDHPEAFANELAFKIQKNMGFKNKEIPYLKDPTNPDSGWDELSDVGVKPKDFEPSPFYVEKPKKQNKTLIYNDAALSGKLDDVVMRDNRNELLDQIRDFRTETFPTLKKMNDSDIEDIVLGKAQGEFRFKTGHEVDITDEADLNLFFRIAKKEQSLLNKYRKQYADEPDVTLFHGGPRAESILQNKGLTRPTGKRDFRFGHSELNIGATSFTRDVNLGLNKSAQMDAAYGQGTSKFGGANPKNYIKTTIPYPEYKFLRINMSVPEYDNMDLNVLAKAVSGDPVNTRPVGLPRSTFYEHEDAVIEPDKFYVSSAEKDVRGFISPKEDFSSKVFDKYGISPAPAKLSQKEIVAAERQFKAQLNVFKKMDKEDIDALSPRELNDYYSTIKSYLKLLVSKTQRTDPSAGVGQQYHKDLENMVTPNLKDLASALSDRGSTEKAYLISRLSKELDDIRNIEYVDKKESILPVKRILDLTDKFSRGGLASKQ